MPNSCCFRSTNDNIFKNTEDNYFVKCSLSEWKGARDRKAKVVKKEDKTQAKAYFRKPYFDGWSGKVNDKEEK